MRASPYRGPGAAAGALLALALLLSASGLAAQLPPQEQSIVGGESPLPLGELADLSVTPLRNPPPELASTAYNWLVFDIDPATGVWSEKKVRSYREGGREGIFFSTGLTARRLKVLCVVTHLLAEKSPDGKVASASTRTLVLRADVVVGKPAPPGPQPPGPAPGPPPDLPAGKYGLAKKVYEAATARVPAEGRQKAAEALAGSYAGVAGAIAAGAVTKPEEVLKKTTDSNRSALDRVGGRRADWEPFFRELQDAVYGLYAEQKINTVDDFRAAWGEIEVGLKAVK